VTRSTGTRLAASHGRDAPARILVFVTTNPYLFAPFPPEPAVQPPAPPARRAAVRTAALVATVGLVAGGVGGAVGASTADNGSTAPAAGTQGQTVTTSYDGDVAGVAARVLPSVVSIAVQGRQGSGSGSGVVLDDEGHILSNNHVVEPGVGGRIEVAFADGQRAVAEVVGRDPLSDLAVLDVDDVEGLTPIEFGRSADVTVGSPVIAIGSPLGLSGTVTTGIVSALERTVTASEEAPLYNAIQTDAAINPGNSGGALVDGQGRLIGINTAISTTGGGGSIGLGFAVPVDHARVVADELLRTGRATHPSIGVGAVTVSENGASGALLQAVPANGAAGRAGLRTGDVVVAVDETPVESVEDLVLALRQRSVGQTVMLTYLRDGEKELAQVTLQDRRVEAS
jgi:putative serine protease PepD